MDLKTIKCKQLRTNLSLCAAAAVLVAAVAGCAPTLPTAAELAQFNSAGPAAPSPVEINEQLRAQVPMGPYRVVCGDLLSLEMPSVLKAIGDTLTGDDDSIRRRVRSDGTLRLPGLDEDVAVKGLTLPEIEEAIEEAYAKAVLRRPAVVVQMADYRRVYVTVVGHGITQSGQYPLRSDQLSLSALLMMAGGVSEYGAETVTVTPAGEGEPLVLSVRDGAIPLADIALSGGERIEVAPMTPSVMTIVGQVTLPGRYPISPTNPPTLIDALAHARGVRETEDARYVSIYRKDADGGIVSARFRLNANRGTSSVSPFHDNELGSDAFAMVKPGDVIVVERTFRSRTRQLLAGAFRVSVGVSAAASATYHEDLRDTGAARSGGSSAGETYTIYQPALSPGG